MTINDIIHDGVSYPYGRSKKLEMIVQDCLFLSLCWSVLSGKRRREERRTPAANHRQSPPSLPSPPSPLFLFSPPSLLFFVWLFFLSISSFPTPNISLIPVYLPPSLGRPLGLTSMILRVGLVATTHSPPHRQRLPLSSVLALPLGLLSSHHSAI